MFLHQQLADIRTIVSVSKCGNARKYTLTISVVMFLLCFQPQRISFIYYYFFLIIILLLLIIIDYY